MNKHTNYDLAQMQSLPLSAKVNMTKQRIRGWYDYWNGNVYVSVSGGKDSQVLAHIVKSMYDDVPLVFVNTGLEYDSVRIKGIELADEVIRPSMDFYNVLTRYGYPVISKEVASAVYEVRKYEKEKTKTYYYRMKRFNGDDPNDQFNMTKYKFLLNAPFRICGNQCCQIMKKKPSHQYSKQNDRKGFVGTLAEESRMRKTDWIRHGCNMFDAKEPKSKPLSFWTEQDILKYIKQNELEIAEIYGNIVYTDEDGMYYDNELFSDVMPLTTTGAKRTGCVFCMFGINQDTDRFLKLKDAEPKKYDYVMRGGKFDEQGMWIPHNGLGYKFVIDWLNENGNLNIKY